MKKIIINEMQKGLLFKNGKFVKVLEPGKYNLFRGMEVEPLFLKNEIVSVKTSLEVLLNNDLVKDVIELIEVGDQEIAIHYIDGNYASVLRSGKHAFWRDNTKHEFKIVDISTPYVSSDIPNYLFNKLPVDLFVKVEIVEYQKGRLFINKKLVELLDSGTYYFWKTNDKVEISIVDTRLMQMDIQGQEILTKDKVALRINFVCNYRIKDYVKIMTEIDNYTEQIRVTCQLALREYVGKYMIDEILENKDEITKFVVEKLKAKEKALFVEIVEAGVKDIILPGEIREIMNTVLIAEKKAQANVISRREEVASTRSLLNTAKLMDENKTLYKLKELEYVERICENVGNITLNGSGDILAQLTSILKTSSDKN